MRPVNDNIACADAATNARDGHSTPLPPLLDAADGQLALLGAGFDPDRAQLGELKARLNEGRFHLAVLGQFKRGKSTLLNALLGDAVLPTSVVPLTSIPTFIRSGESIHLRVVYQDGRAADEIAPQGAQGLSELLARFVTESGNPKNRLGVAQVELFHPAPILRAGLVLIDTPGIGSTFRHNTQTTLGFLPQCDAALFVVSPDPPITEVEIEFLRQVRPQVARLFFILNKADYLTAQETSTTLEFLRAALREQAGINGETPIFRVSARQALEASRSSNNELWTNSGMADVKAHLIDFLAAEKTATLSMAIARKAASVVSDALMRVRLAIQSSRLPMTELERRLAAFEKHVVEAQQQRLITGDHLAGEARRAIADLYDRAEQLRAQMVSELGKAVDQVMDDPHRSEAEAREALATIIPELFRSQLAALAGEYESRVQGILTANGRRADQLVEQVRKTAAELFEIPYRPMARAEHIAVKTRPYWATHEWQETFAGIPPGAIDAVLPARFRRSRARRRLRRQAEMLAIRNVGKLRLAIQEAMEESLRRFATQLDHQLGDTVKAIQAATQLSLANREQTSQSVAAEVSRLEPIAAQLTAIQGQLDDRAHASGNGDALCEC